MHHSMRIGKPERNDNLLVCFAKPQKHWHVDEKLNQIDDLSTIEAEFLQIKEKKNSELQ